MENMETMRAVCVDTDIVVDYLRGREPRKSAFSTWRKRAEVLIASITAFELLLGATLSSKREERVAEVESLLDQYKVLAFGRDGAEQAANIGTELRVKGTVVEIRDLLNASMCLSREIPIVTKNKALYERVVGLEVLTP